MKALLTFLLFLSSHFIFADQVSDYMNSQIRLGKTDYKTEKDIIGNHAFSVLADKLSVFYTDSSVSVRSKAYYFTYKKGLVSGLEEKQNAVLILLNACTDENGGIVGQSLGYLQEFPKESFGDNAKSKVDELLVKKQAVHFKELGKLAGIIGTGQEILRIKFMMPDINPEIKWAVALALARQGSEEHTSYCVGHAKKIPVSNNLVSFIVPDLIYTRQRQAINYCIEVMDRDTKDCYSPNPDKPEAILCGYFIMELLAPAIVGFPFQTDATGTLVTDNYPDALTKARAWFANNPDYTIVQ